MERSQAIALVRETFTEGFNEARFTYFVRNLVNHLDETKKQVWTLKKAAFQEHVNHFTRLGTYTDPRGERMDILVIHLRRETTLARGRVMLRNFVADYMTTGHGQGKAAVIAAFVSPTEDDWRFSFIKLDYTLEKTELGFVTERPLLTPARRYSYLVGASENCHTAQKQFLDLLQVDAADPTVSAIEAAFSVEKVTKEFFEQYRDLFEKSRAALNAFLASKPAIAQEFDKLGIASDDFVKKLLGQIVFLYFLQKKGWFGVDRGQAWGRGRKDFVRHLFTERASFSSLAAKKSRRDSNFFNDILEPLFYDALSRPRLEEDHYYPAFDCRIPFLNGGLFEPLYGYRWVDTKILLPDTLFSNDEVSNEGDGGTGILDVFDRYNFTVNEADPLEREVAVDPEMLGKVFENLLPENIRHAGGTYYTPRVIVHYMCQQALLRYMAAGAPDIPEEELVLFLRLAERFADFEATETKAHADKRLPQRSRFVMLKVWAAHGWQQQAQLPRVMEWLLVEWPQDEPEPTKYWLAQLGTQPLGLRRLVRIAKARWRIEQDYRELKEELGLDHYEGRQWLGWHHHVCLVTVAYAFLRAEQARLKKKFWCDLEPAPSAQATAGPAHQA
jgi:hypothetical protein